MTIETYTDKRYLDVVNIVDNFYHEAIKFYDPGLDPEVLRNIIMNITSSNAHNVFLLIVEDKCEGVLAGIEAPNMLNNKRIFQELIWYVNAPFRRYGVMLLKKAQEILKNEGFGTMIMAVLENSKTEAIKKLYERLGFLHYESHYIRSL